MSGLQTFIAVFGGKEFRDRKVYSLTYGELRRVYLGFLKKFLLVMACLYLLVIIGLSMQHKSESVNVKPSIHSSEQNHPGIGSADKIQRKSWK